MVDCFSFKLWLCHIYQGYLRKTCHREPKRDFFVFSDFKKIYSYARLHEMKIKTLLLIAYLRKILQDFSIFKKQFNNFPEGEYWKIKEEYLTFSYLYGSGI